MRRMAFVVAAAMFAGLSWAQAETLPLPVSVIGLRAISTRHTSGASLMGRFDLFQDRLLAGNAAHAGS